jgi:hypothetical protein
MHASSHTASGARSPCAELDDLGLDEQCLSGWRRSVRRMRETVHSGLSRNSAVCITVMNALPRNDMSADAFLAKDRVLSDIDYKKRMGASQANYLMRWN